MSNEKHDDLIESVFSAKDLEVEALSPGEEFKKSAAADKIPPYKYFIVIAGVIAIALILYFLLFKEISNTPENIEFKSGGDIEDIMDPSRSDQQNSSESIKIAKQLQENLANKEDDQKLNLSIDQKYDAILLKLNDLSALKSELEKLNDLKSYLESVLNNPQPAINAEIQDDTVQGSASKKILLPQKLFSKDDEIIIKNLTGSLSTVDKKVEALMGLLNTNNLNSKKENIINASQRTINCRVEGFSSDGSNELKRIVGRRSLISALPSASSNALKGGGFSNEQEKKDFEKQIKEAVRASFMNFTNADLKNAIKANFKEFAMEQQQLNELGKIAQQQLNEQEKKDFEKQIKEAVRASFMNFTNADLKNAIKANFKEFAIEHQALVEKGIINVFKALEEESQKKKKKNMEKRKTVSLTND